LCATKLLIFNVKCDCRLIFFILFFYLLSQPWTWQRLETTLVFDALLVFMQHHILTF